MAQDPSLIVVDVTHTFNADSNTHTTRPSIRRRDADAGHDLYSSPMDAIPVAPDASQRINQCILCRTMVHYRMPLPTSASTPARMSAAMEQ